MRPDKGPEEECKGGDRLGEDGEGARDDDDAVLGEERGGGEDDLGGRSGSEQRRERLARGPQGVVGAAHGLSDVVAVRVVRVHAQALAGSWHRAAHERLRELGHRRPRLAAAGRLLEPCVRPADHGAPEGEPRVRRDDAQRRREPVACRQSLRKAEQRAAPAVLGLHQQRRHTRICGP